MNEVEDFFQSLSENELQEVKTNMISTLIKKKVIESAKFRVHYIVAIDGTGVASFDKKTL